MIRKIVIIIIVLMVLLLGLSYRHSLRREQGEQFIAHAYYGDLESVKEDVENGVPLDTVFYFSDDERGYNGVVFNALHAAASSGNEDIINFLLENNFDIDAQTPDGWTPLFIAARDGNTEAAKLLIFLQAGLNIKSNLGATALLMAVTQPYPTEEERLDLVTYMLKRGAEPNIPDRIDKRPLFYAAIMQKLPVVEVLLENGAQVTPELYEKVSAFLEKEKTTTAKKILQHLKKYMKKITDK